MPATAGRVRMPADNRISVSSSLKTSEIWQKSVRYDPYAPTDSADAVEPNLENSDKAKGLFALAKLTGASSAVTPGACKKCGQVGHLSHQCRNLLRGKAPLTEQNSKKDQSLAEDDKKLRKQFGLDSDSDSRSVSTTSNSSSSSKIGYHFTREGSKRRHRVKTATKKIKKHRHQKASKHRRHKKNRHT